MKIKSIMTLATAEVFFIAPWARRFGHLFEESNCARSS